RETIVSFHAAHTGISSQRGNRNFDRSNDRRPKSVISCCASYIVGFSGIAEIVVLVPIDKHPEVICIESSVGVSVYSYRIGLAGIDVSYYGSKILKRRSANGSYRRIVDPRKIYQRNGFDGTCECSVTVR